MQMNITEITKKKQKKKTHEGKTCHFIQDFPWSNMFAVCSSDRLIISRKLKGIGEIFVLPLIWVIFNMKLCGCK